MTPQEFIIDALTLKLGQLIVVSGPDMNALGILLSGTQAVMASSGISADVYDAKGTEYFPARLYKSCDAKIHNSEDCNLWPGEQEGIIWESKVLQALGSTILLVANQFDPSDPTENIWQFGFPTDEMIDILETWNIRRILFAAPRAFLHADTAAGRNQWREWWGL